MYYIFLVMGQQSEIGIERVWADAYSTGCRSLCHTELVRCVLASGNLWLGMEYPTYGVPTAVLFRLSPQAPPRLLCVNLWTRIGP